MIMIQKTIVSKILIVQTIGGKYSTLRMTMYCPYHDFYLNLQAIFTLIDALIADNFM